MAKSIFTPVKAVQHRAKNQTNPYGQIKARMQGLNVADMNYEELRMLIVSLAISAGVVNANFNVI
jgi:hypothetical protein